MSTIEQVEDNCRVFADFKPLADDELAVVENAQRAMEASGTIPCTGCDYCAKVCPVGVGFSGSMTALNYFINFGDAEAANYQLGFIVRFNGGKKMPSECIRCGACEQALARRTSRSWNASTASTEKSRPTANRRC